MKTGLRLYDSSGDRIFDSSYLTSIQYSVARYLYTIPKSSFSGALWKTYPLPAGLDSARVLYSLTAALRREICTPFDLGMRSHIEGQNLKVKVFLLGFEDKHGMTQNIHATNIVVTYYAY